MLSVRAQKVKEISQNREWRLDNVQLEGAAPGERQSLVIEDGKIKAMEVLVSDTTAAMPSVDLDGSLILPCFVDMHTHLDKGHIWPRASNPDGQFMSALNTVEKDRVRNWTYEDVMARASFSLRCAFAHGTRAIRTHLDSLPPQERISWPAFSELRSSWQGRIELQMVSLAMCEHYRGNAGKEMADWVQEHKGVLGLVPLMDRELDDDLNHFFDLAGSHDLDADMHIDETLDPSSRTLEHLADAKLRTGFDGEVVAGHCCSLSMQTEHDLKRILDKVAKANIAIVSLPMCNMYLQDRHAGRTPRHRGVTVLHEIRNRGIRMAVASDNTRDPFYAYGDLDMHEVYRESVRIAHLDHPFEGWSNTLSHGPADIMGLAENRIEAGAAANFIVFNGRSRSEILSRSEHDRIVVRDGTPIDNALPDYRELDFLFN